MSRKTLLDTRTRPANPDLDHGLAALGYDVTVAPLLTIQRTAAPRPAGAEDVAALFVTSVHAVPSLAAFTKRPAYAVGPATAAALKAAGFDDVRQGPGDAAGLARQVSADAPGAAILYPQAARIAHDPTPLLRSRGIETLHWTVYESVPNDLPEPTLRRLRDGGFDRVVLTSPRIAGLFARAAPVPSGPIRVAALGPSVAAALPPAWASRVDVAGEPNAQALLKLLECPSSPATSP